MARSLLLICLFSAAPLVVGADLRTPLAAGEYTTVIARADQVLAGEPGDVEARFYKAVALAGLGRRDAALALFQTLTRDVPERPEPWNNLAALHAERGEWDQARDALEQALRTDTTYRTAHDNLGAVYATLAGQAYRKALALDGGAPQAPKLTLLEQLPRTASRTLVASSTAPGKSPAATTPTTAAPTPTPAPVVETAPAQAGAAPREDAPALASVPTVAAAIEPEPEPVAPAARETETPVAPVALAEVQRAVQTWASAWRGQQVADYLAAYTPEYAPAGSDHAAWAAQRSARIAAPKRIELELRNLEVAVTGPGEARARFLQVYRSDTFVGTTRKTLEFERRAGRWLIRAERTGG